MTSYSMRYQVTASFVFNFKFGEQHQHNCYIRILKRSTKILDKLLNLF